MNTVLYIQTNKSVEVHNGQVLLKDIAYISCIDKKLKEQCGDCQMLDLTGEPSGSYPMTAVAMVEKITSNFTDVDVTHIGEPGIIIRYEPESKRPGAWDWIKTAFVALVLFFGAGFSIMTFNTDVNTNKLFSNLYQEITGMTSSGFTEMELFYSIGIGIGVVFFFNHFHFKKKKTDPSALEVQMCVYENDLEMTILDQEAKGNDRRC